MPKAQTRVTSSSSTAKKKPKLRAIFERRLRKEEGIEDGVPSDPPCSLLASIPIGFSAS
jgi:hypothetical protein